MVLAIPRGGVVVGYEIAQTLHLPLDVIIPHKLGAPYNPELAIGAITEDGSTVLDDNLITDLGVSQDYITKESERQKKEIERRLVLYRQNQPNLYLKGKDVIVVDDGIATGQTVKATADYLRRQKPKRLVLAIPVAP